MPAERLSMRKVREVLRLKHTLGMSLRQISEATGVGKTVIGEYVRRARVIGITWPVPEAIDDAELERRLFPVPCETGPPRAVINWRKVHTEMARRNRDDFILHCVRIRGGAGRTRTNNQTVKEFGSSPTSSPCRTPDTDSSLTTVRSWEAASTGAEGRSSRERPVVVRGEEGCSRAGNTGDFPA